MFFLGGVDVHFVAPQKSGPFMAYPPRSIRFPRSTKKCEEAKKREEAAKAQRAKEEALRKQQVRARSWGKDFFIHPGALEDHAAFP